MTDMHRSTLILHGRHAMRQERLNAARGLNVGVQILTFEQAAARLAGGFTIPINDETVRTVIQTVLPETPMGELERIKALPGMVNAAAGTLRKVWRAGIDLSAKRGETARLDAIAQLEAAVLPRLPAGMMRPTDIVVAARERINHAPAIFGSMRIYGLTELSPCWRPLLLELAENIPVFWNAGPRRVPGWLEGSEVVVETSSPSTPEISAISAATGLHEAIEAMRWARDLLATGRAAPHEIAIAAASPSEYDDHFLALRADANIDLHFVHGIKVSTRREGQAASALADILVRGLSQTRIRRLAALCGASEAFGQLPDSWTRVLPEDAPLATPHSWALLLGKLGAEHWPDGQDHTQALRAAIELLSKGPDAAHEIGKVFLTGQALSIWRKALLAGPAIAIDSTIEGLRQDDGVDGCVSVAWMPASALAATPRPFVRLIGLNSSRWPRGISEDRLIPDHIIPIAELDPLPMAQADRRDFETILTTTSAQVVLSRARRDSEGRLLGPSPLLSGFGSEMYIRRNAVPEHAYSETDRLMARPKEFRETVQASRSIECWRNWRREKITSHDGRVRTDHPLIQAVIARPHSATSLRRLLRNPLGFVWVYAFDWRAPESGKEPLVLSPVDFGNLVHLVLDHALQQMEASGGLGASSQSEIMSSVSGVIPEIATVWESERPVPPPLIWKRTLQEAHVMACNALSIGRTNIEGARSFAEVPFGGALPKSTGLIPWDSSIPVSIPDTDIAIRGYIDRVDILDAERRVFVRDYKTGRTPKTPVRIDGGRELQRCLYGFAVKYLLGSDIQISASLLYPREYKELELEDAEGALADISQYLKDAKESLISGNALPGPDAGDTYDDLAFALPANAGPTYCKRKQFSVVASLGDMVRVWEAE
jgi:hypothetical protein